MRAAANLAAALGASLVAWLVALAIAVFAVDAVSSALETVWILAALALWVLGVLRLVRTRSEPRAVWRLVGLYTLLTLVAPLTLLSYLWRPLLDATGARTRVDRPRQRPGRLLATLGLHVGALVAWFIAVSVMVLMFGSWERSIDASPADVDWSGRMLEYVLYAGAVLWLLAAGVVVWWWWARLGALQAVPLAWLALAGSGSFFAVLAIADAEEPEAAAVRFADGVGARLAGTTIAFVGNRGLDADVFVLSARGTRQVTSHPAEDRNPALSADGVWLAFDSNRPDPDSSPTQVYVVRAAGGSPRAVTSRGNNFQPAWSPDGKRLAYASDRDGNDEVYVANADGSEERRLTRDPADDAEPVWSPDGMQLLFTSYRGGAPALYVMTANGSGIRRLTRTETPDYTGAWSPDGSRIAFTNGRDDLPRIMVMRADGTRRTEVTDAGYTAEGDEGSANGNATWSPDGGMLAFSGSLGGAFDTDVYVVRPDGTGLERLTDSDADELDPSWSRR